MEFLDYITSIAHYAVSFIIIISIIVFIHEFGHFYFARLFGVKIDEFSIGFGKEIYGWDDSKGTRWKICILPLGGFVKMHGDADGASTADEEKLNKMSAKERKISFHFKPLWQKAIIVLAGPFANFVLSIFILASLLFFSGEVEVKQSTIVGSVAAGSAAEEIGLKPGDKITSINGEEVEYFMDMVEIISLRPEQEMEIIYERGGKVIKDKITPKREESRFLAEEGEDKEKSSKPVMVRGLIGVGSDGVILSEEERSYGVLESIGEGARRVYKQMHNSTIAIGQLFTGQREVKSLGGPVKIMEIIGLSTGNISKSISCAINGEEGCGELARTGLISALIFMALISTALGYFNLFPIPMLDGGHLAFYAIEAITRRPMAERFQEWAFRIGFTFLIGLMLYITYNDILSFVKRHILS